MKVASDHVVDIHYTLTDDDGREIDTSLNSEPLTYLHGANGLIPGLERELDGREAGDKFQVAIQPADAYGEVDARLIHEVPLEALSEVPNLRVGMQLQSQSQDGRTQLLTVDAIGSDSVTLNANHVLAGIVLHFEVEVVNVREATGEELDHGHPHPA
ncbi:MAG: peptidylprolyl isomerase [Gammaproteobacteria bacterium]